MDGITATAGFIEIASGGWLSHEKFPISPSSDFPHKDEVETGASTEEGFPQSAALPRDAHACQR